MAKVTERWTDRLVGTFRPWLGLALVCVGFSLHPAFLHTFWTRDYLPNILQQAATNIIVAVGMTFVILTGGIDLSVGSVMALCGVALGLAVQGGTPVFLHLAMALPVGVMAAWVAQRWQQRGGARLKAGKAGASPALTPGPSPNNGERGAHAPAPSSAPPLPVVGRGRVPTKWVAGVRSSPASVIPLPAAVGLLVTLATAAALHRAAAGGIRLEGAIVAALAVGSACGLLNGLVITLGRVPPFVVTLGMLTAARGLAVYATNGNSVSGLPPRLDVLGEGVPLVAIAAATVVLGTLLLGRTQAGRYVQAIGGNEEAARLAGVNVTAYTVLAYVLSGLTAAVAALVLTAKFRLADTGAGTNAELNAIAAVVIGGTRLSGGRGSVVGSLIGALTIAVLNAGLVLVGVRDTLQGVVIGAVIVITVMIDQMRKHSRP